MILEIYLKYLQNVKLKMPDNKWVQEIIISREVKEDWKETDE